jgi:predicted phosphodiesterase
MINKYEQQKIKGTKILPITQGICLNHKHSKFNLYFISDLHCGATECNYELLDKAIDMIKGDKTSLLIIGGDTIEAIPRGYKINEEGQHCSIDAQIARTARALKPLSDKTIVMFKGNHNSKSRGESVDSDLMIAEIMGVPYKTVPTVIQIKTPKGLIKLAGAHGKSTNKNNDLELEQLRKIYPGCQMYFLGHTHALYCKQTGALVYDKQGNEDWDPVWLIRTGNFLNYAEYSRYELYAPQRSGFIQMQINNGLVTGGRAITDDFFK